MKVRKDFAKQVAALAQSTPKAALGNLLQGMLPRRPVETRQRSSVPVLMAAPVAGGVRDPFAPRKPRRRRIPTGKSRAYVVLWRYRARRTSKRQEQLEIIYAHSNTADAVAAGAEIAFINFAEKEGFISFSV
jgi:hypothetical protein